MRVAEVALRCVLIVVYIVAVSLGIHALTKTVPNPLVPNETTTVFKMAGSKCSSTGDMCLHHFKLAVIRVADVLAASAFLLMIFTTLWRAPVKGAESWIPLMPRRLHECWVPALAILSVLLATVPTIYVDKMRAAELLCFGILMVWYSMWLNGIFLARSRILAEHKHLVNWVANHNNTARGLSVWHLSDQGVWYHKLLPYLFLGLWCCHETYVIASFWQDAVWWLLVARTIVTLLFAIPFKIESGKIRCLLRRVTEMYQSLITCYTAGIFASKAAVPEEVKMLEEIEQCLLTKTSSREEQEEQEEQDKKQQIAITYLIARLTYWSSFKADDITLFGVEIWVALLVQAFFPLLLSNLF